MQLVQKNLKLLASLLRRNKYFNSYKCLIKMLIYSFYYIFFINFYTYYTNAIHGLLG